MGDFNNELDKINKTELASPLAKLINDGYAHMYNQNMHTSENERDVWNKAANTVLYKANIDLNGLLSKEDKEKLNSIENGANNYTHPKYIQSNAGTYISTISDDSGHVIYGSNPTFLDCTVENATKLKDTIFGEFVRASNQVFGDNVTINPNSDVYDGTPVTFKNFNDYRLDKAFNKSISISTDDDSLFAQDGTSKSIHYGLNNDIVIYKRTASSLTSYSLVNSANTIKLVNGKILTRYIQDDGVPIGTILFWLGSNIPDGYLPMNGMAVQKSLVPELIEYANTNGLLENWNNMMENKYYNAKFVLKDDKLYMPTFNRAITVSANNNRQLSGNVSEWITKYIRGTFQVASGAIQWNPGPNEFNSKQDTGEIHVKNDDGNDKFLIPDPSTDIGQTYLTMYDSGAVVSAGDDMAPAMMTVNYIIKASSTGLKLNYVKQLSYDYYNIDNGNQVRFSDVLDHIKCNNHRPIVDVTISNRGIAFSNSAEINGVYDKLRYERLNPYRQLIIRGLGKSIYYPYSIDLNENNLITIAENKVPNSTFTIQVSKADPYDRMEKFDSLKTRLASYGVTLVKV